ncbi:MAG: methylenetetrahydrofolate--tRNA-(uracil(54)-C(5))-methyltransferase (FADH(2)-oxidizing) TrmFO [Alphaproteobacteria bacterium]|nr:methylenetetrahydrofolate--tRNA-(uracil(54)-C(5))-methyltransferase (FADH(2)-oxidizing) TrmFO [Alphaproteobacteria bacterium]
MTQQVTIIGAGLAGSEAAWQLLKRGIAVHMIEMRPQKTTPAHTTDLFGELVCSNSLRSDDSEINAVGLLHAEMRACDSLIMHCADETQVPAGGALAVNRTEFAKKITDTLKNHPVFTRDYREADLPTDTQNPIIIATGPLTSDKMASDLQQLTQLDSLHFFDAIAPIVYTETVDMNHAWYQSRYDKGEGTDYLNCALSKDEYNTFIDALLSGEKIAFKEWEKNTPYFEGCLPVEVMAERGRQTLLFGPMKPVGLSNPHEDGRRPFAVVQLRKENKAGTLMNLVGFQTKLTYGAQKEVFKLIPALKNAEFARFGGIHRNTFVCGPKVLTEKLNLKQRPNIRLAGQLTGCEGYIESASIGLLAGLFTALPDLPLPPRETALGSMLSHITIEAEEETFQPMNINFGIFPELDLSTTMVEGKRKKVKGQDRKRLYTTRAKEKLTNWVQLIK